MGCPDQVKHNSAASLPQTIGKGKLEARFLGIQN